MAQGGGFNNRYPKKGHWKQELNRDVMHDLASLTSWYMRKDERREEEEQTRAQRTAQIILEEGRREAERRQRQFMRELVLIAVTFLVGVAFGYRLRMIGF